MPLQKHIPRHTRIDRDSIDLAWHRRLFLIDHGASLFVHHTWRDPQEHARRPLDTIRDHVLLPYASSLETAHARLAPLVTEPLLRSIVGLVPDAWLLPHPIVGNAAAQRDAYVAYLLTRLATPAALVDAIEGLRHAA